MGPVYSREFQVRYTEMDAYGHVNNAAYLRYMQEAAFDASWTPEFPFAHWAEIGRAWFIRDTEIEYLRPLSYPDRFTLDTWLSARGQAWVRREYAFRRGDAVTPAAQSIDYPTLLPDVPAPTLRAYPKATVVAEQLHAVTVLDMTNTRMKDFFDPALLLRDTTLDDAELQQSGRSHLRPPTDRHAEHDTHRPE